MEDELFQTGLALLIRWSWALSKHFQLAFDKFLFSGIAQHPSDRLSFSRGQNFICKFAFTRELDVASGQLSKSSQVAL